MTLSHYRAVFDSVNEKLLEELREKTFSNLNSRKRTSIEANIDMIIQLFDSSSNKVVADSNFRCGLYKRQLAITDDDLQYVRSERMDQMTAIETQASKHWLLSSDASPTIE